jgi:FkbM family methyltransferase
MTEYFKDVPSGKFLEIGANDGKQESIEHTYSPSWTLLGKGWSGIYCEPDPHPCAKLIEYVHKDGFEDRVTIFNGAITLADKIDNFYLSIDNSFASSFFKDWIHNPNHVPFNDKREFRIMTNTISFQNFINQMGNDFNYLSTDIEGLDYDLITSIEWDQFPNLRLISTEGMFSVAKHLDKFNFRLFAKTEHTCLYEKVT